MENKSIAISDVGDTGFNFEFQVERRTLDFNPIIYLIWGSHTWRFFDVVMR